MKEEDARICELYKEGMSMAEISSVIEKEFSDSKWYPMKVQRRLKKAEKSGIVEIRDYKEAQKIAEQKGVYKHPTAGRERTDKEKEKIRSGLDSYITNASEEELKKIKKARVDGQKKRWSSLTSQERQSILDKMKSGQVNRIHAGMSKFEEALFNELLDRGLSVVQKHKVDTIGTEVDILIQYNGKSFAVEIDGPTHFLPIYGEEALRKTIEKDSKKNKILKGAGFYVVRYRIKNNNSKRAVSIAANKIEDFIKKENKTNLCILEQ